MMFNVKNRKAMTKNKKILLEYGFKPIQIQPPDYFYSAPVEVFKKGCMRISISKEGKTFTIHISDYAPIGAYWFNDIKILEQILNSL